MFVNSTAKLVNECMQNIYDLIISFINLSKWCIHLVKIDKENDINITCMVCNTFSIQMHKVFFSEF